MSDDFLCLQCELPESRCECQRYCNLCMGDNQVRLCYDGLFYCLECREACELSPQSLKP